MDKKIIIGSIIGIGVLAVLIIASYSPSKSPEAVADEQSNKSKISSICGPQQSCSGADKVEVFMFHSTQRCPTCIKIGQLAKATIEERFPEQLKSGKIEFREINIDLPENKLLAEKFQAVGSALFINAIRGGQDDIKEDVTVWQLASGESVKYKDYLSDKINAILGL
jgi:hypothetical protein